MKKLNKTDNIMFLIHPTRFEDFDIIAVGDYSLLTKLKKTNKGFDLIKRSKFGGIPVLVMDTCDTLRDAMSCIKIYKKQYGKL